MSLSPDQVAKMLRNSGVHEQFTPSEVEEISNLIACLSEALEVEQGQGFAEIVGISEDMLRLFARYAGSAVVGQPSFQNSDDETRFAAAMLMGLVTGVMWMEHKHA